MKMENNPFSGSKWIDLFLVYCTDDSQQVDPESGAIAIHYRFEEGRNPTGRKVYVGQQPCSSEYALGQCDTCGAWASRVSGECPEGDCDGTIKPYSGMNRMCAAQVGGGCCADVMMEHFYAFLTTEEVPDPLDGVVKKLLDATVVEE